MHGILDDELTSRLQYLPRPFSAIGQGQRDNLIISGKFDLCHKMSGLDKYKTAWETDVLENDQRPVDPTDGVISDSWMGGMDARILVFTGSHIAELAPGSDSEVQWTLQIGIFGGGWGSSESRCDRLDVDWSVTSSHGRSRDSCHAAIGSRCRDHGHDHDLMVDQPNGSMLLRHKVGCLGHPMYL